MMKMKKIFALWVANELCKKGFRIKDWEINRLNPKCKVFLFEDSENFQKALSEIMENKNK